MPAFDMKNANFYIVDGYSPTGFLVNNSGGYATGVTTMAIDGGTGALANGDRFQVSGETGSLVHTITSHSETLGNTTSVTFTPAIDAGTPSSPSGFAVNHSAGYLGGTTTMAVAGTGEFPTGSKFTVAGEVGSQVHTVTHHTEVDGDTTSITFTPALAAETVTNTPDVVDTAVISAASNVLNNAVLTFLGHKLHIKIGEGTMSFSEKRAIVYVKDRGRLDTVRKGDEEPVDLKLDFTWEFLSSQSGDTTPTVEEALKQEGAASSWVSTSADQCEPYCVDLYMLYQPPCSVQQKELIILPKFRYEDLGHEPKNAQVSTSGKCNVVAAVKTRAASFVF